jgi:hypothetical protein
MLRKGMGSRCIDPCILDLATWWRVVSFTPRPLYSRGNIPRYAFSGRLGWPQNRAGRRGEEENLAPTGTQIPALGRPDHSQKLSL